MAHTPNIDILKFLLQDSEITKYTEPKEQTNINLLPPLNHYTTGDPTRKFIYDKTEHIICYVDPSNPIFQTPEYQELLSQDPYFSLIGLEVYLA